MKRRKEAAAAKSKRKTNLDGVAQDVSLCDEGDKGATVESRETADPCDAAPEGNAEDQASAEGNAALEQVKASDEDFLESFVPEPEVMA